MATGLYLLAFAAAALAVLIWLNVSGYRSDRDGTWNSHPIQSYKMRRYVNGKWEVRDMTPEELDNDQEWRTM